MSLAENRRPPFPDAELAERFPGWTTVIRTGKGLIVLRDPGTGRMVWLREFDGIVIDGDEAKPDGEMNTETGI